MLARGPDALEETVAALKASGSPDPVGLTVDVADAGQISVAFSMLDERWGSLNALINTVGPFAGTFDDLSDSDWESAFALGTMSAVRCVRAALPLLRKAEWARIVNFAAHSVKRQSPRLVAYTAAKAALTSVSKNLAKSLGPEGILVNTVSPGTIVTASFTEICARSSRLRGSIPPIPTTSCSGSRRTSTIPSISGAPGFRTRSHRSPPTSRSRRNGYVTGANVNVDGGSDFT